MNLKNEGNWRSAARWNATFVGGICSKGYGCGMGSDGTGTRVIYFALANRDYF